MTDPTQPVTPLGPDAADPTEEGNTERDALPPNQAERLRRGATFSPGELVAGRFRIVRLVDSGGMGAVYAAKDTTLNDEVVALKTILPKFDNDGRVLQRFLREVQYARRITHPNVCRIHDVGHHDLPSAPGKSRESVIFVTMQFLDGETLTGYLKKKGVLTPAEALPVVRDMAAGLGAAHAERIIHRDFKSSNVMLVKASAGPRAVITDFGLARVGAGGSTPDSPDAAPPSPETSLTTSGEWVGSPYTIAPEQIVGDPVTAATDVYAFGVVLYEMLTGQFPFMGANVNAIALKRLSNPPTPPETYVPTIDPRWRAVMLKCLSRDPQQRYQTASGVLEALTAIDPPPTKPAPRPTLAATVPLSTPTSKPPSVRRGVLAGVALIALVIAAIVGYQMYKRHGETNVATDTALAAVNVEPPPTDLPSKRTLRIETGTHIAKISRISIDSEERFVVTGSDDKTIRIWDLASGQLLRTIDTPGTGDGNQGMIYAVAMAPDASLIAAGGYTATGNSYSIYLFERESGRLVRRIGEFPSIIKKLAYSPDGKWLLVCLGDGTGIRLFDTASWKLAGEDRRYGNDSYGAAFDGGRQFATTSYDGFLRLYDLHPFRLKDRKACVGGTRPRGVAFSPDGHSIAVGFTDSTSTTVVSVAGLTTLFQPDGTGIANGDVSSVAWSADGTKLFAAGRALNEADFFCRIWSEGGRGSHNDVTLAGDTITDVVPLRGGGFVFASAEPAWGRISAAGQRELLVPAEITLYRGQADKLLVSNDGSTVQFGFLEPGKRPGRFTLTDRQLELDAAPDPTLQPPRVSAAGMAIENWRNMNQPTLNGKRLKLLNTETSRSVALTPDSTAVLVGADWVLYLFSAAAVNKWNITPPATVWAVNVSGDGLLAVAALSDGTIRWYRLTDGQELLALFPHPDMRRWVAWTPSGYYDCSPGGEELIGWHIDHGPDAAAEFLPASRFKTTLYRPDVISNILKTRDEAKAVALAK